MLTGRYVRTTFPVASDVGASSSGRPGSVRAVERDSGDRSRDGADNNALREAGYRLEVAAARMSLQVPHVLCS